MLGWWEERVFPLDPPRKRGDPIVIPPRRILIRGNDALHPAIHPGDTMACFTAALASPGLNARRHISLAAKYLRLALV